MAERRVAKLEEQMARMRSPAQELKHRPRNRGLRGQQAAPLIPQPLQVGADEQRRDGPCRGHPNGARLLLVHSQCWCKVLFGPFFLAPALHNTPASFLQMTIARYPTGNKITDRVAVTRIHNTQCKHTLECTASPLHKQISPRCVQRLQNNPDDTI